MNSASLCSLAGRYDNPLPLRFLAPIDSLNFSSVSKIPEKVVGRGTINNLDILLIFLVCSFTGCTMKTACLKIIHIIHIQVLEFKHEDYVLSFFRTGTFMWTASSYLCTYDLYGPVWGPKWHSPNGPMPFHSAHKSLVMDLHASKTSRTGRIYHRCINS
jgi:hypothetical protein